MMKSDRLYPFYSLLLLLLGAPVLAALASPWVYRWLQSFAAEDSVLDAPFHRVTSRLVLIAVLLLLYPACKLSGVRGRDDFGVPVCKSKKRLVGLGLGLGISSMLIVYLLGVFLGVYAWDLPDEGSFYIFRKLLQILVGGLFIGIFEEILFRGFLLNALRKSFGVIVAILLSSFLFSIVHFMRPVDPETVSQWNSGFLLLNHLFARAGDTFIQEASTLFFMGVLLSLLSVWTRSVYVAIGLHTGWVWVMMLFRLFTDNQKNIVWLYGTSEWVSKAWMGPVLALIFLVGVFATRRKWQADQLH